MERYYSRWLSLICLLAICFLTVGFAAQSKIFISNDKLIKLNLDDSYFQTSDDKLTQNENNHYSLQLKSPSQKFTIIVNVITGKQFKSLDKYSDYIREKYPNATIAISNEVMTYILAATHSSGMAAQTKIHNGNLVQVQIFFNTDQPYDQIRRISEAITFDF